MLSPLSSLSVALLYDQYWFAISGSNLLHGVHALVKDLVPHHDHDDGHCGVYQGQWAVFQLPSLDPLTRVIIFSPLGSIRISQMIVTSIMLLKSAGLQIYILPSLCM